MSEEGERLDIARIMINHANIAQIHTGNIINWQMLKKRVIQTSTEELADGIQAAFDYWLKKLDPMNINIEDPTSIVDISNNSRVQKVGTKKHARDDLKLSVKLFLTQWQPETVSQAVNKVCTELDVQYIDNLLVSFPLQPTAIDEDINNNEPIPELDKVKLIWRELESLVDKGRITHLGVCDFDAASLIELYSWAKIRATMDQISMTNCCSAPEDLIEFSRKHDIELLSHNDNIEILSPNTFQRLISDAVQNDNNNEWLPSFVARYSIIVRCRGIVEGKGYIVSADRIAVPGNEDYKFF